MHETAIALEILRVSQEAVAHNGGSLLVRVKVAVGELTAVEPELLAFAWEAAVKGTAAEGAQLEVVFCPAQQRCPSCGPVTRKPLQWIPICSTCGSPLMVEGGRELDVLQVEFETDGDSDEPNG